MSLRLATSEDIDLVTSMAMKFAKSTEHGEYAEEDKIRTIVESFINSPNEERIVLLYGEVGMLAAMVQPFMLGSVPLATEIAWWVEPEERGNKVGDALEEAFIFWAKKVGAKLATMACYDDRTGKYYEKKGYRLYERAYIKEVSNLPKEAN